LTAPPSAAIGHHLHRFVRFALVGAIATGIQYAILVLLVRGFSVAPTPASCAGFILSAIVNYHLNYRFTFRSHRPHGPAAAKFAVLAGAGLLINAGIMHALVAAGALYLLAQACATAVVLLWNFAGNSLWTFPVAASPRARARRAASVSWITESPEGKE
jgi:putative flippase GtrA